MINKLTETIQKQQQEILELKEKLNYYVCLGCSSLGKCTKCSTMFSKRYEVDIIIDTKVTLHQSHIFICPCCNNTILEGKFPEHITSTMQYVHHLQALTIALNTIGMVSINRTHEILSDLFGTPISTEPFKNSNWMC